MDADCGPGTVSYVDLPPFFGKKVQHFSGEKTVTTGECSFTAVCGGMWNTQPGAIVLNGVVTEGSYAGGRVHVRTAWDGSDCTLGTATMTITPLGLK